VSRPLPPPVSDVGATARRFWNWLLSTEPGPQGRRTAEALTMVTMPLVAAVAVALRWFAWEGDRYTGLAALVLSLVVAGLVTVRNKVAGSLPNVLPDR
jgi:hypothetical protein